MRLEIAGALQRGIPVIPILVDNTPMPKPDMLPPDMQAFAFRNALILDTGIDFHHHADRLVAGIRKLLEKVATKPTITPAEPERIEVVDRAKAVPPGEELKDKHGSDVSAPPNVELGERQEGSVIEAAVSKPTPRVNKTSQAPPALEDIHGPPPSAPAVKERPKFNWNKKQIARAVGGLLIAAAVCFGIFLSDKKKSNTEATPPSPVSESTPVASATPVETAVTTVATATSPLASPITSPEDSWNTLLKELRQRQINSAQHEKQSSEKPIPDSTALNQQVAPSPSSINPFAQNGRTWQVWIGDFIREFALANQSPDANAVLPFYASLMSYFGEQNKDQEYVRHDIEKYNERWPVRHDEIEGEIHLEEKVPDREYAANFKLNFYAESVPRQVWTKGQFAIDLDITIVDGTPKISRIREKTLHQQKGKPGAGANQNAARKSYPSGIAVQGKVGFVRSPYAPARGEIDVRRFSKGTQVKCPFTGKMFVVP